MAYKRNGKWILSAKDKAIRADRERRREYTPLQDSARSITRYNRLCTPDYARQWRETYRRVYRQNADQDIRNQIAHSEKCLAMWRAHLKHDLRGKMTGVYSDQCSSCGLDGTRRLIDEINAHIRELRFILNAVNV